MTRFHAALGWMVLALPGFTQTRPSLAEQFNFEAPHQGNVPTGWGAYPPGGVFMDDQEVHGGKWSVRVERTASSPNEFTGLSRIFPMDFAGKTVELRGFIRTEEVSSFVALWMREDGVGVQGNGLEFATLQNRQIKGTTPWTEYSISVPVNQRGRQLFVGFLLSGTGKAWIDDMQLLVDGKAMWDAPKAERPKTGLDTDLEFDGGSKIAPAELSSVQVANLALLGKVWGFVKYHHPLVTSGKRNWDYDLFRIAPAVLAAPDRETARAAIAKWVDSLGKIATCETCAELKTAELHLRPDLAWIDSKEQLGAELSGTLRAIHHNRPATGTQFFLTQAPGVGNPVFANEPAYGGVKLPDAGFQLLAVYRFWNIIQYWSPYRDVLGENWDQVLAEFIPRVMLAKSAEEYQRETMALIARAHDTHANLWSSMQVRPPVGRCQLPVMVRFVEGRPVVSAYLGGEVGVATGLKPGDAIEAMDGVPVAQLIAKWKPYYAASNDAAILRDMGRGFTHGECVDTKLQIRRDTEAMVITAKRVEAASMASTGGGTHDRPGDTFQKLSPDVAYLKLSSVKIADVAKCVDSAAGTKGLIIDIRNYPSEFVVFALGSLLVDKGTPFARFTTGDLTNPGAFHFGAPLSLTPGTPHYEGKVVILVDEVSQSQAEYTTMALRSAAKAYVIGSTTAGADGNVSSIPLPGNLRTMISGIGVFYPDKRPTQRVGIVPDLEVKPTIAGIRAGRDELVEAAVKHIAGKE